MRPYLGAWTTYKSFDDEEINMLVRVVLLIANLMTPLTVMAVQNGINNKIALPANISENIKIHDFSVLNQDGRTINFYRYLIKNKTVAINFVFTGCTSSCPLSMAIFRQTQKKLGKRPVQFITISVDPGSDTPERLLEFSQKFNAGTNWQFITGEKSVIDQLLKQLGVFAPNRNDHTNVVIVGNDAKSRWQRLYGFPQSDEILASLKIVASGQTSK